MNIKTQKNYEYTVIIGCGSLGANLANAFSDAGKNVLIMDIKDEAFRRLSSSYGGLSVVADGTDFNALKEANLSKASSVIIVTNNDNTNIMIAQMARHIFNVSLIIARLYDSERECVYKEFDIDTICPSILSVKEIDKLLGRFKSQEEVEEIK